MQSDILSERKVKASQEVGSLQMGESKIKTIVTHTVEERERDQFEAKTLVYQGLNDIGKMPWDW